LQFSMKDQTNVDEKQLEYVKSLQLNVFKEGFLFDLFTNMETFKTGLYFIGAKNFRSAVKHLEMAVSQDNPLAMVKLAEIYLAGKIGDSEYQMDQAISLLEMAADNKFVMAIPKLLDIKLKNKEEF